MQFPVQRPRATACYCPKRSLPRRRMGSGGPRGLQNRCFGAEASKGWFDSDAPPPKPLIVDRGSLIGLCTQKPVALVGDASISMTSAFGHTGGVRCDSPFIMKSCAGLRQDEHDDQDGDSVTPPVHHVHPV